MSLTPKTKMSLIALLLVFLSSCVTTRPVNFRYEAERCFVSTRFDKCRCFDYVITPTFSGNVSSGRDEDLSYCDNLVGFAPDDWVRLVGEIQDVVRKTTNQKTLRHESAFDILSTLELINMEFSE